MLNAEKIPGQAVTWSTDNLQSGQVPEEPQNLDFLYVQPVLKHHDLMFFIKGYLLSNYPSRDLQGGNKLACDAGSQKSESEN